MLYDPIDSLSSVERRPPCAYGLWTESRYVDPGWDWFTYDWHVYGIYYCLFMIIGNVIRYVASRFVKRYGMIFQIQLHVGKGSYDEMWHEYH
jgi:hypothetical protein